MGCLKVVGIIIGVLALIALIIVGYQYIVGTAILSLILWAVFPGLNYWPAVVISAIIILICVFAFGDN